MYRAADKFLLTMVVETVFKVHQAYFDVALNLACKKPIFLPFSLICTVFGIVLIAGTSTNLMSYGQGIHR